MTYDPFNLIYENISKCFITVKYMHNVSPQEPEV